MTQKHDQESLEAKLSDLEAVCSGLKEQLAESNKEITRLTTAIEQIQENKPAETYALQSRIRDVRAKLSGDINLLKKDMTKEAREIKNDLEQDHLVFRKGVRLSARTVKHFGWLTMRLENLNKWLAIFFALVVGFSAYLFLLAEHSSSPFFIAFGICGASLFVGLALAYRSNRFYRNMIDAVDEENPIDV